MFLRSLGCCLSLLLVAAADLGLAQTPTIDEIKSLGERVRLTIEQEAEHGPIVVLPQGMPRLAGYGEHKDSQNRRVISLRDDPLYVGCISSATKTLYFDTIGGIGVDPVGLATNSIASIGRAKVAAADCVTEYRERLKDALGELAQDNDISALQLEYGDLKRRIGDFSGRISDLESMLISIDLSMRDQLSSSLAYIFSSVVTKDEMTDFISSQMGVIRSDLKNYFDRMQAAQDAQKARDETLTNISLTESGLTAAIELGFAHDPDAVRHLTVAVQSFAKLASLTVTLGSTTGPVGVALVALSAVGVFNDLVGSMGKMGPTTDEIILEQIGMLRQDVSELHEDMRKRFDALFQFMDSFSQYVATRFNGFDQKLTVIIDAVNSSSEQSTIKQRLANAALLYLVSKPINMDADRCLVGASSLALTYESYTSCLANFALYATDIAKLDLVAGSGQIPADPLGDVGRRLYFTIDGGQAYSYLLSFYNSTAERWGSTVPPNPAEWIRGVDAYLQLLDRFDRIPAVAKAVEKNSLIAQDRVRIDRMVAAGLLVKTELVTLRSTGMSNLITLYAKELDSVVGVLVEKLPGELAGTDLGITHEATSRREWFEQMGSSSLFRACGEIDHNLELTVGPEKGRSVTYQIGTVCGGTVFTNKDNDTIWKQQAMAAVHQWPESQFSFSSPKSVQDARHELQSAYLEAEKTKAFPVNVMAVLVASLGNVILSDQEVAAHANKMVFVKALLSQEALLGYEKLPSDAYSRFLEAVSMLPSDSTSLKGMLNDLDYARDANLKESISNVSREKFKSISQSLMTFLATLPPSDEYAAVDRRIRRLMTLSQ